MPTRTNRDGQRMASPDTTNIDRRASPENTGLQKTLIATETGGIPTPPPVPNGRHIANGEAVSPAAPADCPAGGRLGFLTAYGSWDSHAVTLKDGKANTNPRAGQPYDRVTWPEIVRMVDEPTAVPKERAQFFIPSLYAGCDGRTHEVQRTRGLFSALAIDIDTGNPTLDEVAAAVATVTGGARAEIYSSSSAKQHDRKWRVLVPLATTLPGADYADTQTALFELLAERGLRADVALARPGQPVYLPNVPPKYRAPDGRPVFYQSRHVPGPLLALVPDCAIVVARQAIRERKAAEEAAAKQKADEYKNKRLAHIAATGDDFEPIAHFNANHSVAAMLARYGFQPQPNRPNHYRHPESQKGSYATEDLGDHWVCLSEWANTLNVGRATRKGFRSGDAFDLFAAFEHGGDRRAAVRAYAAEVRPAAVAKTRREPEPPPPPGRVEVQPERATVPLEDLRAGLRGDLSRAVAEGAPLVVCTPEPGVGKTTAAVETLAGAFDQLLWVVDTHAAATETVKRLHEAGHLEAAAIPPRDATTCQCWTSEDAARLRQEHPAFPYVLPMADAIRVGNPHLACLACPLSGLKKPAPAPVAVDDFAAWADPYADTAANAAHVQDLDTAPALEHDGCRCEYWRRKREADAARITVLCQARFAKTETPRPAMGSTRAIVIDEHGTDALLPRQSFDLETIRATRDAMATAVDNWRASKNKMRWSQAREKEHELLSFAEAVVLVANNIVSHMETLEAAGGRVVDPLPSFAISGKQIPKRAHTKLSRLLIQGGLPESFDAAALDLVRRAASGTLPHATVYVEPVPGGGHHAQIVVASARFDLGTEGERVFVFDANADMAAIRRPFPHVVEISPAGAAPLAVDAVQWWHEINPSTHPAVVVSMLERAIHEKGFKRAGVILCKRHRDTLFPVTRPRGDRLPEDKEPDPERIANWGGRNGRALASGTAEQRLARARELVERVRHIRQFIARDEHGRLLIEHHHGAGSRGTNKFLVGTDGGVVLGQTRCPPGQVAAYMLGTGRGEAVKDSDGKWGDVEGELPAVGGGTTKRRWRGYACPEWAEAARQLNRAALSQVCERFRTRLETGVPVVLVATEPVGLPVADPPATVPEGVAAVVGAVRELTGRPKVVRPCEDGQSRVEGGESGNRSTGHTEPGVAGESGHPSTGHAGQVGVGVSIAHPSTEHTTCPYSYSPMSDRNAVSAGVVEAAVNASTATVRRWLADAVGRGLLVRTGTGRWTRYALPAAVPVVETLPRPLEAEPADVIPPAEHLEEANAMFAEAAMLDEHVDGPPAPKRRASRAAPPNAPTAPRKPWQPMRNPNAPPGPTPAVLAAIANARQEIRQRPEWNAPGTWDAIRDAIPPDAARDEMARVEAALPPRFRAVRRE